MRGKKAKQLKDLAEAMMLFKEPSDIAPYEIFREGQKMMLTLVEGELKKTIINTFSVRHTVKVDDGVIIPQTTRGLYRQLKKDKTVLNNVKSFLDSIVKTN